MRIFYLDFFTIKKHNWRIKNRDEYKQQILGRHVGQIKSKKWMQYNRLNAAGRLDDMRLGIQCLLAETEVEAATIAQQLHTLNLQRRSIEADMQEDRKSVV